MATSSNLVAREFESPRSDRFWPNALAFVAFVYFQASFQAQLFCQTTETVAEMIADRIDVDAAATVHICDFQRAIRELSAFPIFASPEFTDGMKEIEAFYPTFASEWTKEIEASASINQLHIVVWVSEPTESDLVQDRDAQKVNGEVEIVFLINTSDATKLSAVLDILGRFVYREGKLPGVDAGGAFANTARNPGLVYSENCEDWLIAGDSKERVSRLRRSLAREVEVERSLATDRRFRVALKKFSQVKDSAIMGFARPEKFPGVFGSGNYKGTQGSVERLDELPAAGFTAQLMDDPKCFLITSFITTTYPETGLALEWTAGRPLPRRFPCFCYPVNSVWAKAWDPQELHRASRENYDRAFGEGSYQKKMESEFGLRLGALALERSSARYDIAYEDEYGLESLIVMEKVADPELMTLYVEHLVEEANKEAGSLYHATKLSVLPESAPDALAYGISPKNRERQWQKILDLSQSNSQMRQELERRWRKALEKSGKTIEEIGPELTARDGWVLTKDWLFQGNVADVYRLIDYSHHNNADRSLEFVDLSQKIDWLVAKAQTGWPALLRSGTTYVSRIKTHLWVLLRWKYGDASKDLIMEIMTGKSYDKIRAGETFNGDAYDLALYFLFKSVVRYCDDVVICTPEKRGGDPMLTIVTGVFFGEE